LGISDFLNIENTKQNGYISLDYDECVRTDTERLYSEVRTEHSWFKTNMRPTEDVFVAHSLKTNDLWHLLIGQTERRTFITRVSSPWVWGDIHISLMRLQCM